MNIWQSKMMRSLINLFAAILLSPAFIFAQNLSDSLYKSQNYRTVIPGENYKSGMLHNLIFGKHWRDLWTMPLEVEIIDLNKFAGGLKPIKKGGGFQTKSLRFEGADGFQWKFRSIDKDPAAVLPKELQETFAADVLQDQISSSNPFAAIIVAPILREVGIMQSLPKIVLLPDDDTLDEFYDEFNGVLGTIEIHPDEYDENEEVSFSGSDKIMGTFKLLNRLEKERDEKVNSTEFLKARLIDAFLGDWDRHVDQWRWVRLKTNKGKLWYPIPRDRDQAFSKFDGIGPSIAEYYTPQLNHFGYDYPPVLDITWSGRHLDRRFLVELTKSEWDSVTISLINSLTDETIYNAVNQLPQKQFDIAGAEIVDKLISRRKLLSNFSQEYYKMIQEVVDVRGSDKDDYFEIERLNEDYTEVSIFRRDKNNGEKKGTPFFYKLFENSLTSEIRIFLQDGDDKAVINGIVNNSPIIRIIGGDGKDEIDDESEVQGYLWSFLPIEVSQNKTFIYDSGKKTIIKQGSSTVVDNSDYIEPETDELKYEPLQEDRISRWVYRPYFESDTDNGIILGSSLSLNKYGFRVIPFDYQINFFAAFATAPESFNFRINGIFNSVIKNSSIKIDLTASELNLTKYFGYGNKTDYSVELENDNFYRLQQKLIEFKPSINFSLFHYNTTSIELGYSYQHQSLQNENLLDDFPYTNYGLGNFSILSSSLNFQIDGRDNINNTQEGFYFSASGSIFPKMLDNMETFYKANFDLRGYATMNLLSKTTFAFRSGGGKLWGKYPFFKAEFLGGTNNLRGFRRERFSGDASIFLQAEMRAHIGRWNLLIPGQYGLLAFTETGRVFVENEDSDKWHSTFGGGLWISFIERTANVSFVMAKSTELTTFILKFAMGF